MSDIPRNRAAQTPITTGECYSPSLMENFWSSCPCGNQRQKWAMPCRGTQDNPQLPGKLKAQPCVQQFCKIHCLYHHVFILPKRKWGVYPIDGARQRTHSHCSYLIKHSCAGSVCHAIREVQKGNTFYSPSIPSHLHKRNRRGSATAAVEQG